MSLESYHEMIKEHKWYLTPYPGYLICKEGHVLREAVISKVGTLLEPTILWNRKINRGASMPTWGISVIERTVEDLPGDLCGPYPDPKLPYGTILAPIPFPEGAQHRRGKPDWDQPQGLKGPQDLSKQNYVQVPFKSPRESGNVVMIHLLLASVFLPPLEENQKLRPKLEFYDREGHVLENLEIVEKVRGNSLPPIPETYDEDSEDFVEKPSITRSQKKAEDVINRTRAKRGFRDRIEAIQFEIVELGYVMKALRDELEFVKDERKKWSISSNKRHPSNLG